MDTSLRTRRVLVGLSVAVLLVMVVGLWPRDDRPVEVVVPPDADEVDDAFLAEPTRLPDDGRGTDVPPHADAGPASTRAKAEAPVLALRVVSTSGPVAGASVAWSSLAEESTHLDALSARTDSAGRFQYRDSPAPPDSSSVLWVSHPEHVAQALVLKPERDSWPTDDVVLAPAPPSHAVVTRGGKPVEGARVTQVLLSAADSGLSELLSSKFRREVPTDAQGRAALHPVPGVQRVSGRLDRELTAPWTGTNRKTVELELRAAFSAVGIVRSEIDISPYDVGVRCDALEGLRSTVLGRAEVGLDGRFEFPELPVLEVDGYRFALELEGAVPDDVRIAPPSAGARVPIDLEVVDGNAVWAFVLDEEGNSLSEAEVIVRWQEAGRTVERRGRPREDGYTAVTGCRAGPVQLEARCPGYEPRFSDTIVIPEPEPRTFDIVLTKSGRIRGRVVRDQAPVEDFTLFFWAGEKIYLPHEETVENTEDGSFVLESVPLGRVSLMAAAPGLGQSETVELDIQPSSDETVELALRPGIRGRGRVIDAVTRKPLPEATVQAIVNKEATAFAALGAPQSVQRDGSFELDSPSPGILSLRFEAPGYSTHYVQRPASGSQVLEVGIVALQPTQSLTVRLLTSAAIDPRDCKAQLVNESLPPLTFDADGQAVFEGVSAGVSTLFVTLPDGSQLQHTDALVAGLEWEITLDARGSASLLVELVTDSDETFDVDVVSATIEIGGPHVTRHNFPEGARQTSFTGLSAGPIQVEARDSTGRTVAGARLTLSEDEQRHLQLRIGAEERRFRLLGSEGEPASGAIVTAYLPGEWLALGQRVTNDEGEFSLFGLAAESIQLRVHHPELGTHFSLPAPVPPNAEEPTVVVLPPTVTAEFVLQGVDGPISGLSPDLRDPEIRYYTDGPFSDELGRVSWTGMGEGDYAFILFDVRYWSISRRITLSVGMPPMTILVHRRTSVRVRTVSTEGLPVPNVPFELDWGDPQEQLSAYVELDYVTSSTGAFRTGPDGIADLDGIPEGEHRYSAEHGGSSVSGTAYVDSDGSSEIVIVLP